MRKLTGPPRSAVREILAVPGARAAILYSALGRMPVAMTSIALLFYLQRDTGSYAIAGLISGSALAGTAVGSIIQGRLVDRNGAVRPLLVAAAVYGASAAAMFVFVENRFAVPILMVCASVLGLAQPALATASRALWTHSLPRGRARELAFTYEAISLETFFILGPALAAIISSLAWAGSGLLVAVVAMILGTVGFATSSLVRTVPLASAHRHRPIFQILALPGMQTLLIAVLGLGVTIGFVEVAVPAEAVSAGLPALGGVLLGLWSLTSVVFGIAYARRPWPRTFAHRAPALLILFGLLVGSVGIAQGDLLLFTILLMISGLPITPQATLHSLIVERVASEAQAAEAFGWVLAVLTAGVAIGHLGSGQIVEHLGPSVTMGLASIPAVLLGVIVILRRSSLARTHDED